MRVRAAREGGGGAGGEDAVPAVAGSCRRPWTGAGIADDGASFGGMLCLGCVQQQLAVRPPAAPDRGSRLDLCFTLRLRLQAPQLTFERRLLALRELVDDVGLFAAALLQRFTLLGELFRSDLEVVDRALAVRS